MPMDFHLIPRSLNTVLKGRSHKALLVAIDNLACRVLETVYLLDLNTVDESGWGFVVEFSGDELAYVMVP